MNNLNKFTTLTLSDGTKLTVMEITSGDIFIANFETATQQGPVKYAMDFFLWRGVLRRDGDLLLTNEELLNFNLEDYRTINQAIGIQMMKLQ